MQNNTIHKSLDTLKTIFVNAFMPVILMLLGFALLVLLIDIMLFLTSGDSHVTTIQTIFNHYPLSLLLLATVLLLLIIRALGYFPVIIELLKSWRSAEKQARYKQDEDYFQFNNGSQTKPPLTARTLGYVLLMIPFVTLLWSVLAEVDVNVDALGNLVPRGLTKHIQPAEAGVVRIIHVKNGDRVKAGQVLVELDASIVEAEHASLVQKSYKATAQLSVLRALLKDAENPLTHWQIPDGMNDRDIENYRHVLLTRSHNQQEKLSSIAQEGQAIKAEIKTIEANITKIKASLPLLQERYDAKKTLSDKGLGRKDELLELEERLVNQKQEINVQYAHLQELQEKLRSNQSVSRQTKSDFELALSGEIIETEATIKSTEANLPSSRYKKEQTNITAPVDGVIEQSILRAPGQVVQAAEQIMLIVPASDVLETEFKLFNKDIGFVKIGQSVDIRIDTFQFTKYGSVQGKITDISSDAIEDPDMGFIYTARASMERDFMEVEGRKIPLTSGMSTTAAIKIGKRRVIEFLLTPLLRYKENAFRER